jgi:hypothetical protein
MATVTAGALITAGLRRADMKDSPNGFIKHPAAGGGEAFDLLNNAISELFDILYEAETEGYSTAKPTWSTANDTADYALSVVAGSTFYHVQGVDYWNGSQWVGLGRVNLANRNDYPQPGTPQGYALEGDNLTIYPTPNAVYSMRVRYESEPPVVDADATPVNLKGPWKEFIETHIQIACLEKAERDVSAPRQRLWGVNLDGGAGSIVGRVRAASKKRDAFQPTRPVDVMGDDGPTSVPPFASWTG